MFSPTGALCSTSDIAPELHYNSHKVCLFQNRWHQQCCCPFALCSTSKMQVLVKIWKACSHTCSARLSIILASAYMFDRGLFILMCVFGREQPSSLRHWLIPPESNCVWKNNKKRWHLLWHLLYAWREISLWSGDFDFEFLSSCSQKSGEHKRSYFVHYSYMFHSQIQYFTIKAALQKSSTKYRPGDVNKRVETLQMLNH